MNQYTHKSRAKFEPWFLITMLLLFYLPLAGLAQHPLLNNFSGFQKDESIYLSWTFTSGSQCNGTRIFRSGDGEIFQEVGLIPGICGASETPVTYSFIDSVPFPNTMNYYRLELGNQGFSTTLTIAYFVPGKDGYSLITSQSSIEVLVAKPPARKGVAQIFGIRGNKIDEFEFSTQRISLMQNQSGAGTYIFRLIYENGAILNGKFIRVI